LRQGAYVFNAQEGLNVGQMWVPSTLTSPKTAVDGDRGRAECGMLPKS
jgi:hypothetical protein